MAVFTRIDNFLPVATGGTAEPGQFVMAFFGEYAGVFYAVAPDGSNCVFYNGAQVPVVHGSGITVTGGLISGTITSVTWTWEVQTTLATLTGLGFSVSGITLQALYGIVLSGDDTLNGFAFGEEIRGENGDDMIYGNGGADGLYGGNGNDTVHGGDLADYMTGDHPEYYNDPLEGHDLLYGYGGNDAIFGGHRNDTIYGGGGDQNYLNGDEGDDFIVGGSLVSDQIYGGDGDDTVEGSNGGDYLQGGNNSAVGDTLSYSQFLATSGNLGININLGILAVQDTGAGLDSIANFENVRGSAHDDTITGDVGRNVLSGGNGNDHLNGSDGDDDLVGDSGNDVMAGGAGNDALYGGAFNDTLTGGTGRDALTGGTGRDLLAGGEWDDTLTGGGGNDTVSGGTGRDVLTGGTGSDAFVFDTAFSATNVDRIVDFSVVDDRIRLDDAVFVGLSAGTLAASRFVANQTGSASDTLHRILCETATGKLFFDADGSDPGLRVHFATLTGAPSLTNADFVVF